LPFPGFGDISALVRTSQRETSSARCSTFHYLDFVDFSGHIGLRSWVARAIRGPVSGLAFSSNLSTSDIQNRWLPHVACGGRRLAWDPAISPGLEPEIIRAET
jgi:hypothetical protein